MATPARRGPRAFTLLEMLVGAVMALMIASVALGVLVGVQQVQRDAQSRNAIARDAQFALEQLGYDLQFIGVGVPRGESIDGVDELRPALRIGTADYLAFIGDLPYPNADLNGIAIVNDIKSAGTPPDSSQDDEIVVTSELSPCAPEASPTTYACPTHQLSLIPIGATAADKCAAGAANARTCPWGLGKWQRDGTGSVQLVFSGPAGRWQAREWSMNNASGAGGTSSLHQRLAVHLDNHDQLQVDQYVSTESGVGIVAHLDRVFYSLEAVGGGACTLGGPDANCVLMRRHCWGPLGSASAAGFPNVGGAPIGSASNPDNCDASTTPPSGTPWETLVNGVDEFSIRYFRDAAHELTPPLDATEAAQVQFIEVALAIERRAGNGNPLRQAMTRRFYVENSGGFVPGSGAPAGSCNKGDPWCGKL